MKRVVFVLLLLASASAEAGWMLVDSSEDANLYANFAPIRKKGNLVTIWFLLDLPAARRVAAGEYLSVKIQQEYDCGQERRYRKVFTSFHSGNMGSAQVVDTNPEVGEWVPISPGDASERYWKSVCKR